MVQVWHCVSIKTSTVAECTLPSRVCVLFRVCVSTLSWKIFFALDSIDSQGVRSKCAPFARPLRVTLWGGQSWRWHEHGGELTASWRNGVAATTLSLASERRRPLLPHNAVGSSQCSVRLDTFQGFQPLQRVGLRLSCRWGSIFFSLPFLRSPLRSLCACVLLGAPFFLRLSGLCRTRLSLCCVEESVSLSGVLVVCVSGRWWESRVAMRWERAVNASPNGASPSLPFTFPPLW